MTSPTQAPLPLARHFNQGLFSDYYLNEIVPKQPEWDALFEGAKGLRKTLLELRQQVKPETLGEAQLEDQWIKPVLTALGHHFAVQVKIRYGDRFHRKPDYVFVGSAAEVYALADDIYEPHQLTQALAVGDAKAWGSNLDQTPRTGNDRNPSQQIDEYLRYSELEWGILTDGRIWRLYHRDSSKHNRYYAVDLDALLAGESVDDLLYFYAFFRQEAFTSGWLAKVLKGSEDFAEKLSDKLEEEVYEALEGIAQGFLDYRRNRLTPTPETLRLVYEQSLVLLYRLLFIFYAESREILPLNQNAEYTQQRSLKAIKADAALALDWKKALHPDSGDTYNRLRDLFFAIDAGDERLDMPPYNGRLFADADHPFLKDYIVGDEHLVPALDRLARVDVTEGKQKKRVFVDYRDLDVRHLGSIYEKLLEYELAVADVPLALKGGVYTAAGAGETVVKQAGQVYLRTGSNERKVTGSYYTPDYIVRFIVEKTLDPLLNALIARHADQNADGTWQVREGQSAALVEDILALNVLDPATGSGHFIVDATAYMAERLRGLGLRPADLGEEDELVYWKRQVAAACVYALDINPLAVELAKLSMWLTTLAKGKPLSFLDHHLRVGNSLVGARLDDIRDDLDEAERRRRRERAAQKAAATGQSALFTDADFASGVRFAVAQMAAIEHANPQTVSGVKQQEQLYADLRARLKGWLGAAHVWTARAFGLELTADQWHTLRKLREQPSPAAAALLDKAAAIAHHKENRFFHWELEFPEVFFDAEGRPLPEAGFDAVIGNPPYVRQERIQAVKPYLESAYEVYSGTADLFLYFYEQGLKLVKAGRRVGYITSGTFMNSHSAADFRRYLRENAAFEYAVNFGENQPFKGAEMVYPTILVYRRGAAQPTFKSVFVADVYRADRLHEAVNLPPDEVLTEALALPEWRFQPAEFTRLFQKITTGKQTLEQAVSGNIYYGIKTGFNEAFIIDDVTRRRLIQEHPSSAEIIKPMLRGEDLRPWYQIERDEYLIFTRQGTEIDRYPAIKSHLEKQRTALEPKPEGWTGKEWPGRKSGSYQWFEIQDNVAYHNRFESPKVYWAEIAKLPRFSLEDQAKYVNNKGHMIATDKPHILAILNSRVCWFVISQIAVPLRLRAGLWQYQVTKQFVERLPIPALSAAQESALGEAAESITALARERYALHQSMRQRIASDLGGGGKLNTALEQWWELPDLAALRAEVKKAFKGDVPLKERGEWESFLREQTGQHAALTAQIVAGETRLNAVVYAAFGLTAEEIALVERATQYPYGAV